MTTADWIAAFGLLSFALWLYQRSHLPNEQPSNVMGNKQGYILVNAVSHARHLPVPAVHAFTYPTLSVLVDVKALTRGELDLGTVDKVPFPGSGSRLFRYTSRHAWIFSSGCKSFTRLMNIRPASYLLDDGIENSTLLDRLHAFGRLRGMEEHQLGLDEAGDVWLMTSPSYMGFEGINPLSIWLCYDCEKKLQTVLLEVHNTFGERHVYTLRTGVNEDPLDKRRTTNVEHQWTIPRQFHVSPFNDRSGSYICSLSGVAHPHILQTTPENSKFQNPKPNIRLDLVTTTGICKLTATSRTVASHSLTTNNLLLTLLQYPFTLLLTMMRISYQAAILHYVKRLNVFARPEPVPGVVRVKLGSEDEVLGEEDHEANFPTRRDTLQEVDYTFSQGIGWQSESWLERYSRVRVESFVARRAKELNIDVVFVSGNPVIGRTRFAATGGTTGDGKHRPELTIYYLAPRFFLYLLVLPSARHAILLGREAERLFNTNDTELFLRLFAASSDGVLQTGTQVLRTLLLPHNASLLPIPLSHPLDDPKCGEYKVFNIDISSVLIVALFYGMQYMEKGLYSLFGARFVQGNEPWNVWGRLQETSGDKYEQPHIGSVRTP